MKSVQIMGVRVDEVTMDQAINQVEDWLKGSKKRYIVTPNVEFVIKAQSDPKFKKILNEADLAVPDSARFGWAVDMARQNSYFKRLLMWPTFLFVHDFPKVTGTDLMDRLCKEAVKKNWTVGFIGGRQGIAEKTAAKYPGIKVSIADTGGEVAEDGEELTHPDIPKTDLLFVAFGQGKQEKWIVRHLEHMPVKVAVGVGGAFDYLSGQTPRAPKWMRDLGLEWLHRLVNQPWRIRRYQALVQFILQGYFFE